MITQLEPRRTAVDRALLAIGQPVDICRAAPADLAGVRHFYERLGDTSTYYRFFGLRRALPDGELQRVVGEGPEHVTLLASIDGRLIGIGEYIIGADPTARVPHPDARHGPGSRSRHLRREPGRASSSINGHLTESQDRVRHPLNRRTWVMCPSWTAARLRSSPVVSWGAATSGSVARCRSWSTRPCNSPRLRPGARIGGADSLQDRYRDDGAEGRDVVAVTRAADGMAQSATGR
jgi:hypothetical protein